MKPHYLTIRNQEGETTYDFRLLIEQTSAEPPSSKIIFLRLMFTILCFILRQKFSWKMKTVHFILQINLYWKSPKMETLASAIFRTLPTDLMIWHLALDWKILQKNANCTAKIPQVVTILFMKVNRNDANLSHSRMIFITPKVPSPVLNIVVSYITKLYVIFQMLKKLLLYFQYFYYQRYYTQSFF